LGATALWLLNSALFSAWMAGGPPNPYPDGWARRSAALFAWAFAATAAAGAIFRFIRTAPRLGRGTAVALAICLTLVAAPWVAREVLIDKCLDGGGRWNAQGLTCEN